MGLFDVGKGGFSGGGIGSSANTTSNTTDNKNNAITGDQAAIYDTRGGDIIMTSQPAFDFASKVNEQAAKNLTEGTAAILDKVTVDSGERINTLAKYGLMAGVAIAALLMYMKR